jgi:TonB-linked SusC/RagA family outer membrane protein
MRTNVEGNFTKWFKAAGNISVARTLNNTLPESGNRGLLMAAITASPLKSPYDESGNINPYIAADAPGYFSFPNPLYQARVVRNRIVGRDISAGLNADIEILKGLHYKPQVYARMYTEERNTFVPTTVGVFAIGSAANLSPGAPPYVNSATNQKFDITNWGVDNLLTYDKTFNRHSLSVLAGYTAQKQSGELSQINASNFPSDNNINFLEASQVSASVSDYTNWSLAAFFGRINYDYDGKYLLDLNFRREGSSRFGKNNKYGNFPSASIGWRISQESFYPQNALVNELKLRSSFGKTGNSAIGDFDRLGTVLAIPNLSNINDNYNYVFNNTIVTGRTLVSLGDEYLRWETARQIDIGVTIGVLHDRITLKADYFSKTTEDMLFNVTLPQASGFASTRVNIGEMVNKGWDFEVSASLGQKGSFTWNTNLNLSLLHNEVTSMPSQISKIVSTYNITEVGRPVGSLYGYQIDGIFNSTEEVNDPKLTGWPGAKNLGAYIYKDINNDGKIDVSDQTVIGNPHPKVVLGFNNVFAYRNFSLSVLATGAFGYQILPEINEVLYNEKQRWNVSTAFLKRWRSTEDPGDGLIPAVYYAGQHSPSNIWIENGDHLWIKNITLGYKIPQSLVNKVGFISGLRFYISVQNAFKITSYTGWNPEVSYFGGSNSATFGVDNFSYPLSRIYTLGASLSL